MELNAIGDILNNSLSVGLIVILVFAAWKFIPKVYEDARADRQKEHAESVEVIRNNTEALNTIKTGIDELSNKVDTLTDRVENLEQKGV